MAENFTPAKSTEIVENTSTNKSGDRKDTDTKRRQPKKDGRFDIDKILKTLED